MFSVIELAAVLIAFAIMLVVAAGAVYVLYRLVRRAARDGARDADGRSPRPPR